MPNRSNEELRQDLAAVTVSLQGLERQLATVHKSNVRRIDALADHTQKARRRTALTVTTSVLLAMFMSFIGNNLAIRQCFLSGNAEGLHHSTLCNTVFPGYNSVVDLNRGQIRKFNQLLRQIPANVRKNQQQDRRLAKLEGK